MQCASIPFYQFVSSVWESQWSSRPTSTNIQYRSTRESRCQMGTESICYTKNVNLKIPGKSQRGMRRNSLKGRTMLIRQVQLWSDRGLWWLVQNIKITYSQEARSCRESPTESNTVPKSQFRRVKYWVHNRNIHQNSHDKEVTLILYLKQNLSD